MTSAVIQQPAANAAVLERDTRPVFVRLLLTTPGLIVARLLILGSLVGLWQYASGRWAPEFWISSPTAIAAQIGRWFEDGSIWPHFRATLTAMVSGYVLGCISGVGLGLILGFIPGAYRVVSPFMAALYSLPKVALAPLFVIVLGIDIESKIALVTITVFFLVLYSTLDGVRAVDKDFVQSFHLMGATRRETATKLLIPYARPWIFSGMRIAVRYALTAAILGELIAANRGMGYLIEFNAGQFKATGVFAAVVLLAVFCVALTEILTRFEGSVKSGVRVQ
ncbi:ABC transporter permease [Polaromonas sp. P1(28)-13]|nr:ABC transporter permease [Polaromonas sp. P1(28)-13]